MRKIVYSVAFIATILNSYSVSAQGILGNIKNAADKTREVKREADKINRDVKDMQNDINTAKNSSNSNKTTKNPNNSNQSSNNKSKSMNNTEPTAFFIKDMQATASPTTDFTESDLMFFVFDYGMDLQTFFDKYIKAGETSFYTKLTITTDNNIVLYEHQQTILRYPVKNETEPVLEILQVGKDNVNTDMVRLAYDFPKAVISSLTPNKTYNLKYKFTIVYDLISPPVITKEGTLTYEYRQEFQSILAKHLGGFEESKYTMEAVTTKYSTIHQNNTKKAVFMKGNVDINEGDASKIVTTTDLSTPLSCNFYLDESVATTVMKTSSLSRLISYHRMSINFYIDNKLIITHTKDINEEDLRNKTAFNYVLIPENGYIFGENKFDVGAFAHVMSNVPAGVHTMKMEILFTNNAGTGLDVYSSGEIKFNVNVAQRDEFCRKYGRPKYSMGVLEGQSTLLTQVKDLISKKGDTPIYIYANDEWKFERDVWGNILNREVLVYYVIKNATGRCELREFFIRQKYDGNQYYAPISVEYMHNTPSFKFLCCQNY